MRIIRLINVGNEWCAVIHDWRTDMTVETDWYPSELGAHSAAWRIIAAK